MGNTVSNVYSIRHFDSETQVKIDEDHNTLNVTKKNNLIRGTSLRMFRNVVSVVSLGLS